MKHTIAFHIINLARKTRKYIDVEHASTDLSYTQASVLLVINSWKKISQTEIASYLHLEPASVVSLVDNLEEAKIVERKITNDRRKYQIVLTQKGQKIADEIKLQTWKLDNFLKKSLTKSEISTFVSILDKLYKTLDTNGKEVKNELSSSKQYLAD